MTLLPRAGFLLAGLAALGFGFSDARTASAQVVDRGNLVATGSPSADPVGVGGEVIYTVNVKNDSTVTALGVLVTMDLPDGSTLIKCTPSVRGQPCVESGGIATTTFAVIKAHASAKVTLIVKMPTSNAGQPTVNLYVKAHADDAIGGQEPRDGDTTVVSTLLAPDVPVVFQPTQRTDTVSCGDTITSGMFQSGEDTIQLNGGMACPHSDFALRMAASGKTLSLNKFKIVGASTDLNEGSVGILVGAGANNVTIDGGSTRGTSGIEFFDYCLKDEGGNSGLTVRQLRCFRARSAGIDIVSNFVDVQESLIDRTVGGSATAETPGGVGIHVSGNVHIKNTTVRRSATIGIWADGSDDPDGNGRGAVIDGGTRLSRIEQSSGIGILLQGKFHNVKETYVEGDGSDGVSTDGVVVSGDSMVLDSVDITEFGGRGVVVTGIGAQVSRTSVEDVKQDGFVVTGANAALSGNSAMQSANGFVVSGAACAMDSNDAENIGGTGYVLSGEGCHVRNNKVKKTKGGGYVASMNNALFDTNQVEASTTTGFVISGNNNVFKGNSSNKSTKGNGFEITGSGNHFTTNSAEKNKGCEWVIKPGNVDDGNNRKNGRTFQFTLAGAACVE